MSRSLDSNFLSAIQGEAVSLAVLFYADLPTTAWRGWTGYQNLSHDSQTWEAMGGLTSISAFKESPSQPAEGITVTFAGVDASRLGDLTDASYWGCAAEVILAAVNFEIGAVVGAMTWFSGHLDSDQVTLGAESVSIVVGLEHRLRDLRRKRAFRLTPEDQKLLYPSTTDKAFDYVHELKDKTLPWGR